jgi:hypothetical protein
MYTVIGYWDEEIVIKGFVLVEQAHEFIKSENLDNPQILVNYEIVENYRDIFKLIKNEFPKMGKVL